MAGTVGARGVINKHPLIDTIQQTGNAFKDMGNLFNQTRQARAYEKSVENQHWQNMMGRALEIYDKFAEATDEGYAYEQFGSMFEDILAGGGMDPKVAQAAIARVTNENINPRLLLGRAYREGLLSEGGFDQQKVVSLADSMALEAQQANKAAELTGQTTADGTPPSQAGQRGWPWVDPNAPVPEPQARPIPKEEQPQTPFEDQPGATHEFVGGPPPAEISQSRSKITPENVVQMQYDFRSVSYPEKIEITKKYFPELEEVTRKTVAALETVIIGIRDDNPMMQLKAIHLWEQDMYKEQMR